MLCAKSKGDSNSLMPVLGNKSNRSMLLRVIDVVIGRSGLTREVIQQQFRILIGDGNDTDFWNSEWIERCLLRICLSRIYALARSKSCLLANFGRWEECKWKWEIDL